MDDKTQKELLRCYLSPENIKHAYLFESSSEDVNLLIDLAKEINDVQTSNKLILEGLSSDIKVIFPDGNVIKKQQILNLQEEFFASSVTNKKRIYIISNAAKLNKSSANTLLKFLEEPPEGVVAFLLVKNRYNVISTISSRCILIALNNEKEDIIIDEQTIEMLKKLEEEKKSFFVSLTEEEKTIVQDRESFKEFLKEGLAVYEKALRNVKTEKFMVALEKKEISLRLEVMMEIIDYLDKNINPKMLLNKMIYMIYGGEKNA